MPGTEYEKMTAGEWFDGRSPEFFEMHLKSSRLCREYNAADMSEKEKRRRILEDLLASVGRDVFITPPFFCDFGCHTHIENGVYMNMNCMILDCAAVYIGAGTLLGPDVRIFTVDHALDPAERGAGLQKAAEVRIGRRVWIGGGSIILSGVTVGDESVIGAGSVVTRDIPGGVLACGNPCRVIRTIN